MSSPVRPASRATPTSRWRASVPSPRRPRCPTRRGPRATGGPVQVPAIRGPACRAGSRRASLERRAGPVARAPCGRRWRSVPRPRSGRSRWCGQSTEGRPGSTRRPQTRSARHRSEPPLSVPSPGRTCRRRARPPQSRRARTSQGTRRSGERPVVGQDIQRGRRQGRQWHRDRRRRVDPAGNRVDSAGPGRGHPSGSRPARQGCRRSRRTVAATAGPRWPAPIRSSRSPAAPRRTTARRDAEPATGRQRRGRR